MKGSVLVIADNTCAQTRALSEGGHVDLIEWIGVRLLPGALHVATRNEWSFRVIGDVPGNPAAYVDCNMFLGIKVGLTITGPNAAVLIEDNIADVLSVQQTAYDGPANIFRCDSCLVDGGGANPSAPAAIMAVRRTVVRNFIVMEKPFASVVSFYSQFTLANGGVFELSGTIGAGGAGAIIRGASRATVMGPYYTNVRLALNGDGCRFIVANNTFAEVRAGGTAAAAGGWGTGGVGETRFIDWQTITVIGGGSAVPTDALFLVTGNVVRLSRPPTASGGTAIRLVVDTVVTPSTPTALFGDPTALSEAQRAVAMASSPYSSSPASSLGAHHGTRVSVAVVENIVVYAGPLPAAGAAFADTPPLLYIGATAAGAPAPLTIAVAMEKTVFGSYYAASTAPGAAPLPLPAPQSAARAPLLAGGSPRQPLRLSAAICSTDYYPAAAPSLAPWHSSPSPAAGSVFRYGTLLDPLPTAAIGASLWAARIYAFRLVGCDSTASVSITQTHSLAKVATRTYVTDSLTVETTASQTTSRSQDITDSHDTLAVGL